ncbi:MULTISPECIES: hypothetical protein [Mycobacteroides]|uniref:Uncharacterized protein n=1 Tax=Mycobacteroides immunogenum TaxID=83262 RepID=A0A179VBX9_9MYCO|nr:MULTISPECIES: hypothetical protein [Mycobacteroides]OAT69400.1 hypothetical protein AWB85_21810 [Mycobacteroides immunogenum]SKT94838.1 Uncharacterised protein [Mycobacteroides abscessus subsp. massiliense]SKU13180.1 Uncharacterised protein [Mycobacteroides abscessus subsp. massiliense]
MPDRANHDPGNGDHRIDDRRDDGRALYRVAVVVFAEAKGADRLDASHSVAMTLRDLLHRHGTETSTGLVRLEVDGHTSPYAPTDVYLIADVHQILDASMALSNGYLWCEPTRLAFPAGDKGAR